MTSNNPTEPENTPEPRPQAGQAQVYLTRAQVAALYPISIHTLAALASRGLGPRFYKPTGKCLYLAKDVEDWIAAAVITRETASTSKREQCHNTLPAQRGRGNAIAKPRRTGCVASAHGRKSLPPSPKSALHRQPKKPS